MGDPGQSGEGADMHEHAFKAIIIAAAAVFTALFAYWCIPPQIADPDIIGAFAAGFVNPYASGYAADTPRLLGDPGRVDRV
jgi:hypothetical protein